MTPTGCEQMADSQGFPHFDAEVSQCAEKLQQLAPEDRAAILRMIERLTDK